MVVRYNATGYDPAMTAQHGGSWVRYSDYAELERKLTAALAGAEAERDRFANGLRVLASSHYKDDQHQEYARHVLGLTPPARAFLDQRKEGSDE